MISKEAYQPTFEGMPELPDRQKMSAARLFTPAEHGWDEAQMMATQTPAALAAVWPEKLRYHLVGPGVIVNWNGSGNGLGKQAVIYKFQGRATAVALARAERLTYSYNLHALGDRTELRAEEAPEGKYSEGDIDAGRRAGIHAVEERLERIGEYMIDLTNQRTLLKKLSEALEPRHRGLQRMGSEKAMREGFDTLQNPIISNMLSALMDQRGWSNELLERASGAILAREVADRKNNQHLRYSELLCKMLLLYGQEKLNAFQFQDSLGKSYVLDHGPKTII